MPEVKPSSGNLRPPVNRKVALYVITAICGVALLAFLLLFAKSDPQAAREKAAAAAEQKVIQSLPAGDKQQAASAINQQLQTLAEAGMPALSDGVAAKPAATPTTPAPSIGLPPMDAATLAELDKAYQASKRPARSGQGGVSMPSLSVTPTARTQQAGVWESYPKTRAQNPAAPAGQADPAPQSDEDDAHAPDATYTALTPLAPPSNRILSEGSMIRAALLGGIDTRNAGRITAIVTQNVYSSLVPNLLLVPKGSRLVGTYTQKVSPGLPRIPVSFSRMILPDGRAVNLGGMGGTDYAGNAGVEGDYHSNILRALGPSLVVALIGTAIDRQSRPSQGLQVQGGTIAQSPSVVEQMAPQVNSQIMSRYGSAQPYFIVPAGTAFKINTTHDIVIPAARSSASQTARRGQGGSVSDMPESASWEAQ